MAHIPATAAYFRALNERNPDAFADCFADRCEIHNPFGHPPYLRRESVRAMFSDLLSPWENFQVIPKAAYRSGNRVAVMWMAEGTGAEGHQAQFEGVTVFELDGSGRIVRLEGYWDARAAEKQRAEG